MKSAITLSLGNVLTSKAQVRCKIMEATLLYQIFVFYWQVTMVFGQKIGQNPYRSIVSAEI